MSVFRNMLMEITSQPPTPTPYTELEYIESTGTQLINTLITPTISNKLEIDYQLLANTTNTMAFGTRQSWTKNGFFACADNNVIGNTWYLQFSNKFLKVGTTDTQRHTLIFALPSSTNSNYFDVIEDNNKIGTFIYPSNFSGITPIYLFGAYDGDASGTNKYLCSAYKFYYCKIYDGENLVRDYIPVLDSQNVPCLYDKVSGEFFYNAGTGTFNYELKTNTITFDENYGWTEYQPVTVNAGQSIDLSQYTIGDSNLAYTDFGGWTSTLNDDATLLPSIFTPTEDITIHAYWGPNIEQWDYNSQSCVIGFKNIANLSSAVSSSYIDHLDDSGGDTFEIQYNGDQVGEVDIYYDENKVYVDIYLGIVNIGGKIEDLTFNYVSNADFTKFTGTGSYFDDEVNYYTLDACFNALDLLDENYEPLYLNLYNSDTQSEYFTDAMNLVSQLVYYRNDGE